MMRPVILSRPSKMAIGWLILSARAASGAASAAPASAAPANAGPLQAKAGKARLPIARAQSKRFMAGALLLNGGGMKAARVRGRDSRPRNRRQLAAAGRA